MMQAAKTFGLLLLGVLGLALALDCAGCAAGAPPPRSVPVLVQAPGGSPGCSGYQLTVDQGAFVEAACAGGMLVGSFDLEDLRQHVVVFYDQGYGTAVVSVLPQEGWFDAAYVACDPSGCAPQGTVVCSDEGCQ